jgi:hypothetical protein
MSKMFSSCFIIASCSLIAATAVEPVTSEGSAKALEILRTQDLALAKHSGSQKHLGNWKNFVPDFSGWIEVDPATGRPMVADLPPPLTNLNALPLRPATDI